MVSYLGILGDPAKLDLYSEEFYDILNVDETNSCFYLIGASENNVTKNEYRNMYTRLTSKLKTSKYSPIPNLSGSTDFRSRIGLFPSSSSHLIKGPSFSFAPFPVNSHSNYLKFKSTFLRTILRPFLPFKIRSLAYVPLGGKAAAKTKAKSIVSLDLSEIFSNLRLENKFDWYYLEAGSGQDFLSFDTIQYVLTAQLNVLLEQSGENIQDFKHASRLIIPNFIYGGGIRSKDQIKELLEPQGDDLKLIPQVIIIGNLSEENIGKTYELVELVGELNELETEILST